MKDYLFQRMLGQQERLQAEQNRLRDERDEARACADYWHNIAVDHARVCDERLARLAAVWDVAPIESSEYGDDYVLGWNDCRAAMRQAAAGGDVPEPCTHCHGTGSFQTLTRWVWCACPVGREKSREPGAEPEPPGMGIPRQGPHYGTDAGPAVMDAAVPPEGE